MTEQGPKPDDQSTTPQIDLEPGTMIIGWGTVTTAPSITTGRRQFQELLTAVQGAKFSDKGTLERDLQLLQSSTPKEVRLHPEVASLVGQCRRAIKKLKR